MVLLAGIVFVAQNRAWQPAASAAPQVPGLAAISAASFQEALAPDAIVAVFGSALTPVIEAATTVPLPVTLAGTQVLVNGQPAGLFFVSPGQINLLLPTRTAPGVARIEVKGADGAVRAGGDVIVRAVAPAIFTANTNGQGVPVAAALRRTAAGQDNLEAVARLEQSSFQPAPLQFGPASERLFLILFLSGARGAACADNCANVRVVTGGQELTPLFVGGVDGLAGLDQINVELPRDLRGRSKLFVYFNGAPASNEVELEYLPYLGSAPLRLERLNANAVNASDEIILTGNGFATTPADNHVTIGDVAAPVLEATSTQLKVRVPYGARSGAIIVESGANRVVSTEPLNVRTSLSGLVSDASAGTANAPVPLEGIKVRLLINGQRFEDTTKANGFFLLKNVPQPTTFTLLTFDTSGLPQRFAGATLFPGIINSRDNQLGNVRLAPVLGEGVSVQQQSGNALNNRRALSPTQPQPSIITLRSAGVVFEVPVGSQISTPQGDNTLNLTALGARTERDRPEQNLAPVELPAGVFSSRIVQITPFDARFAPGGKLTFPNTEELSAGTDIELYSLVQDPASNERGKFVVLGKATLGANNQIETEPNAIRTGGYYFVAAKQPPVKQKLLFGRVVERAGAEKFPVAQAFIQVQGQVGVSDGSGLFAPRQVPIVTGRRMQVTASFRSANGRFAYVTKFVEWSDIVAAGETLNVGELTLANTERPPVVIAPETVTLSAEAVQELRFKAYDPDDPNRALSFSPDKPDFASIPSRVPDSLTDYQIRLTPGTVHVGQHQLLLNVSRTGSSLSTTRDVRINVLGAPRPFRLLSADAFCDDAAPSGPTVRLVWAPAPLAASYEIYRREGGGELKVGETGAASTSFTDKCLAKETSFENCVRADSSYEYSVLARNASGEVRADNRLAVSVLSNICVGRLVTVALPQLTGTVGSSLTVPVIVGDLSGRVPEVLAFEFDLTYDQTILQFEGLEKSGSLSQDIIEQFNPNPPGRLRVAAIVQQRPLAGASRTLLKLRFRLLTSGTSPLVWRRFNFNEGTPVNNTPQDGRITVN